MIKILRKHRNWLMIVITILALPFVFYFVKTDYSAIRPDRFARVYDRDISMIEARRDANLLGLAMALGMSSFVQDLTAGAKSDSERSVAFILNLIILRHEAERLGIHPTGSEVADFVRNLRPFRGASGFDINKYTEFTQQMLAPTGMSEAQLEELARDELCLNRIKQLVATGVFVPENESKAGYEQAYGKLFVSAIWLRGAEFAKDIKVSDEDVQKYYDAHKADLKTDEKRKVEFVTLGLTEEQKKLTGKERIDVLQKLADRANDFTQALLEKGADFHQVAAKFQLPVQATGEFKANDPDPKLKADAQLATTAFQLTAQQPDSDAIQTADGFYVLHLAGIVPARPLTIDEAKPKILETVKASRARELLSNKGAKVAHDLREGLKAGEPLSFALEKVNAKAEKIPPFTLLDDVDPNEAQDKTKRPPDFIAIKNAVASLQPGEVSEFFPWEDGGIIAVLEKREPPDPAKYQEKSAAFAQRILNDRREIVFYEWLRERQREAGLVEATPPPAGPPRPGARPEPQPAGPPPQGS
jgi:peptidyl-prolyl cis-trans isomerase D